MKDQFENIVIKGVHATRYIMSWIRMGGEVHRLNGQSDFGDWLKSLGLTDEECDNIVRIATNGRMELETSAKQYLKNLKTAE